MALLVGGRSTDESGGRGLWTGLRRLAAPVALVALVLFSLVASTGLLIVHGLDTTVGRWDADLEQRLADSRTTLLDSLTGGGTWLAETMVVAVLTVLVVAVAAWATRNWRAPAFLALCVLGEKAVYLAASLVVDRPRPAVPTLGHVYATTSYPSGHVGSAVALYGGVAVLLATRRQVNAALRWAAIVVAVVAPAVVGYARMYRGFHYPTDVVAGALLGVAWVAALWALLLQGDHQRSRRRDAPPLASPE
jgi:undecaprenyl-diphosphatase